MSYDSNARYHLDEFVLLTLTQSRTGWVDLRPQLSAKDLQKIKAVLPKEKTSKTKASKEQVFKEKISKEEVFEKEFKKVKSDLGRIFPATVEMAEAQCRLKKEADALANQKGQPNRPPSKLGVKLRDEIAELRNSIEEEPIENICKQILDNPPLETLVTPLLEEAFRASVIDPLQNAPDQCVGLLPPILDDLGHSIDRLITRGPPPTALRWLAMQVVFTLKKHTSYLPKRSYRSSESNDSGPGLAVCRILARAVNDALSEECRRSKPADMSKPYREALKML